MSNSKGPGTERLTPEAFFGPEAAPYWRQAIDALHKFAHRTDALPGDSVFDWYVSQTEAYHKAAQGAGQ
jgi:hypothetical protein